MRWGVWVTDIGRGKPSPDGQPGSGRVLSAGAPPRNAPSGTRGSVERTLPAFCEADRGARFCFPRGTLALARGPGDGWPPDPRARRHAGRTPQACVSWWRRVRGAGAWGSAPGALRISFRPASSACGSVQPVPREAAPPVAPPEGIAGTRASETFTARQDEWAQRLPSYAADLWAFVVSLNTDEVLCLLTFCAAQTVNAVKVPWERKTRQLAAAETLAQAVDLDMTRHWTATSRTYFRRVIKAHIAAAVREAVTPEAADRIAPMKKADMADAAEQLVAQTGWLPPQMRTAEPEADPAQTEAVEPVATEGSALSIAEPVDAADEAEAPDTEAEDAEDIYAVAA